MEKFKVQMAAVLALVAVSAMMPAHAALPEAVTTAITGAQTDLLALFAALTAAGVAIWVGRIIYNKFKVR